MLRQKPSIIIAGTVDDPVNGFAIQFVHRIYSILLVFSQLFKISSMLAISVHQTFRRRRLALSVSVGRRGFHLRRAMDHCSHVLMNPFYAYFHAPLSKKTDMSIVYQKVVLSRYAV